MVYDYLIHWATSTINIQLVDGLYAKMNRNRLTVIINFFKRLDSVLFIYLFYFLEEGSVTYGAQADKGKRS